MNKLFYIAISSGLFGFMVFLGNEVRLGEDFAGSGTHGVVQFLSTLLGIATDALGHSAAGYTIMGAAVFGGIFTAIMIWRDELMF